MILRFVFFLLTTLSGLLILSNLFIDGPFHSHPVKVTFVWTHEESGVMKYLQWLATRRLANIRLTRWNDQCADARETFFSTNVTDRILIQVYLMPSINHSHCSSRMNELVQRHGSTRIYFTRRSLKAITTLPSAHWRIIYAEDLIEHSLTRCEFKLIRFLSHLGLETDSARLKAVVEHDSYQFTADATWWDQSDVGESSDFYRFRGNRSFTQYLADTRRCVRQGRFPQMHWETLPNRTSTQCISKAYDCAFSDVYSFEDREQIYQHFDEDEVFHSDPLKCAFAVPSIFDPVRERYARNETCQTIVLTSITNCYDPLPEIQGPTDRSFCLVAIVDRRTKNALKNLSSDIPWDLIDLGVNITPFRVAAKTPATLRTIGYRLFPVARWIVWLDGRSRLSNLRQLLNDARAPFMGARHSVRSRTSASEVRPVLDRLRSRAHVLSTRLNDSLQDVRAQEKEYRREGFYARSDALGLKMFDAAVIISRTHQPCLERYLCAWYNEVLYFSFRVQLSIYYPAVRMNLTDYFFFLPEKSFSIKAHRAVC